MVQNAVVKKTVAPSVAEISLMRQLECGLSCKSCDGCPQRPKEEILALADNPMNAVAGDVVEVVSTSGSSIGIAALVYLVPCIGLMLGYLVGNAFALPEMGCVACAFAGILVGFVPAVLLNRVIIKRKKPEFKIIAIRGE